MTLQEKIEQAIWVGKSLFDRGKVSGSAANLSFRHDGLVYITASGGCFGALTPESFVAIDAAGSVCGGKGKPSKEWPLHLALYELDGVEAVLHTHSPYATLWSCLEQEDENDVFPALTPYLRMRVGRVPLVPFAQPGSEELFRLFRERRCECRCYLLQRHGPVAGNRDLMQAFFDMEELEETARILWHYQQTNQKTI